MVLFFTMEIYNVTIVESCICQPIIDYSIADIISAVSPCYASRSIQIYLFPLLLLMEASHIFF